MSRSHRRRLAALLRDPTADLAEAALLCAVEADRTLNVDAALLRIEALTDGLRTRGFPSHDAAAQAASLAGYLHGNHGFTGDRDDYHDPRNSLLHEVLERRRGLPITLSILYVAVARRLRVPAFGVGLPGHFVAAIHADREPVVFDPFHDGRRLDTDDLGDLVRRTTAGRATFTPDMVAPADPSTVVRRLLTNLTRDYLARGDIGSAEWTMVVRQILPDAPASELREYGELLVRSGSYRDAARVLDRYLERFPDASDADEVRAIALRARAKLN